MPTEREKRILGRERDRQRVENLAPIRGGEMSDVVLETELAMRDLDRLAKFKQRTVDPEAVWVCEQLEATTHQAA